MRGKKKENILIDIIRIVKLERVKEEIVIDENRRNR
jgi:hypothetical protein